MSEATPCRERRLEEVGEQRLADRTDEDREHGDPELDERDEADGLVHEARAPCSRPAAASLGALLEPRAARGDERVLGRDEDRAPQHEEEHDERFGGRRSRPGHGAQVLGG